MEVYELIKKAIIEKKQVHAKYKGRSREMCPHILGTKSGKPRVLFYQFGGDSKSELSDNGGWRCIPLDGLEDVSLKEGEWHTVMGTTDQRSSCVDEIDVEVK